MADDWEEQMQRIRAQRQAQERRRATLIQRSVRLLDEARRRLERQEMVRRLEPHQAPRRPSGAARPLPRR